jgi:DNA-binding XRE family transcriptional regulator
LGTSLYRLPQREMKKRIKFQTISGSDGSPAFVVVPYKEFMRLYERDNDLIPHALVESSIINGLSPARAWREYLDKTQEEVANLLGMSQANYSKMEVKYPVPKKFAEKLAPILGISPAQLDF